MIWEKALVELRKGNVIHLEKGINYLFLYKPNHYIIFDSTNERFYRIHPNDNIKNKTNWEVDNTFKKRIYKLLDS